jgi:hypothetical protein
MRSLCERLHVPYYERPPVAPEELEVFLGEARWHNSAEGERRTGVYDGEAMVAVWQSARLGTPIRT